MWQDLVKVALLGTENSQFSDRTLQALQAQGIDVQQEPATVLAQGAALLAQMKKAGFRLETYEGELPEPLETSGENYLSPKSARHLEMMLSGRFEAVLPEFMALALENKRMLPPESLPDLLNRQNASKLLEKMLPAIGAGGRWLLAQNPSWRHFVIDPGGFDWHTGSKTERLALLQFLRKTDLARSLELLQSTWESETPADKTDFLETFWTGLSSQDEPFLEACLDDRRKEVGQRAARLLAKIPGSRLSERMWQRASVCFDFEKEELRMVVIGEGHPNIIREGIIPSHPIWRGGTKANFLGQVVSLVPPERWETFFLKPPAEILELFKKTDWSSTLLKAIGEAAFFFKSENWLEQLLVFWVEHGAGDLPNSTFKQSIDMMPGEAANKLVLSTLQAHPGLPDDKSPVFHLLKLNPHPLQDELTLLVVNRFQAWLNTNQRHDWQMVYLKDLLKSCALRSNPALSDDLQKGWYPHAPTWSFWEKAVEEMLNTMQFRKEMKAELQQ